MGKKVHKHLLILAVLIFILVPVLAFAAPVPDPGVTKCYNNQSEITCPSPGEPFYGQDANYNINPHSYTKLGFNGVELPDDAADWLMVRDNVTGLVWEIKHNNDGVLNFNDPNDGDNWYRWCDGTIGYCSPLYYNNTQAFINALNTQNYGGFNNWRMPTVNELVFLMDFSNWNPMINTTYFPETYANSYWSSNIFTGPYTGHVWWVVFYSGSGLSNWPGPAGPAFARGVRGEQFTNNFVDNGDSTVTDTATGLMWQKSTAPGTYSWQQGLQYCENLNLANHDDWRLPDINEIQSLVDYNRYNPAIDTTYFPDTQLSYYFSSTPVINHTTTAWGHRLSDGIGSGLSKGGGYYVLCVRGGECGAFGDTDLDGVCENVDNCPSTPNGPNLGTCSASSDKPNINCTTDADCANGCSSNGLCIKDQRDGDNDGHGDVCDNCITTPNPKQLNNDNDALGNACDDDDDNDGILDGEDNCPNVPNPDQADTDGDMIGDACDC